MSLQNNQYSSGKFSPTRSDQPCPICDDVKGKCRIISDDLVLCMTYPTNVDLSGWHYLGETKGSYYAGKYVRERQESETERQQRQETNRRLKVAQQKSERERFAKLPDATQRDRLFKGYFQKLNLNESDISDLQRRRLTEPEIGHLGAKSIKAGYIVPIRNPQGQILGAQIRLRDVDSGRYRWHKLYGIDARQQNGELPLAFHAYLPKILDRVVLVEGTGVKPFLAAKIRKCSAIGASSGQFVSCKETLTSYLLDIGANPTLTRLEYAIDAGDVINKQVMLRHENNLDFLVELGYSIDVLWWGQFTKDDDDIDELSDRANIQLLTITQFFEIAKYKPTAKLAPFQWLQNKLFLKPKAKGFARSHQITSPALEYKSGTRLETWRNSLQSHKHVLDASATGMGKSHDAGLLRPELLDGIDKIIYVSNDSRNVTTETLQEWQMLPARHRGLTDKNGKLRRANYSDDLHTKSNCSRTGAIAALQNKAIFDTRIVCETCPLINACRHSSGDGFGFRHERAIAFKSNILRSHPASLPSPDDYDYSKTLIVWEEVGESFVTMRQIQIDRADIDAAIAKLSRTDIDHRQQAIDLLNKLHRLLENKSRFGLDYYKIKEAIPEIIDSSLLANVLEPDLSILDTVDGIADSEFDHAKGKDKRELARLNSLLKSATTLHSVEVEQRIEREVLKQWLSEFLDILSSKIRYGDLHIQNGKLTVSLLDARLREIANKSASNLYLDATINQSDLEMKLASHIHVVKQADILLMPTIYQVADIGRLGMQRGNEQTRQAEAIASHLCTMDQTTKIIDFKKFDADGAWFRDSRGSNDFKDAKTFVVTGTPCQNIAALKAEFVILTGFHPEEEDQAFMGFIDRHILANVRQCFGRKLGNRFQEGDVIYFLSDFDLGDIPHIQVKASDITPKAMSKKEIFRTEVSQRFYEALDEGIDLVSMSQRQIADWLNISWGKFRHHFDWIDSLLKFLYSNPIQNLDENLDLQFIDAELEQINFWASVTERFLNDAMPMKTTLEGIFEFFAEHIPQYLHQSVVTKLSSNNSNRLFSVLAVIAMRS
ncbi:MAG: hypothetical protein ACK5VA_12885 [Pseudanabaena sp.]|jgi:hypothetical protein